MPRPTRWLGAGGQSIHGTSNVRVTTLVPDNILNRGDTYTRVIMRMQVKTVLVASVVQQFHWGVTQIHQNIPDGVSTVVPAPVQDTDYPWYLHGGGWLPDHSFDGAGSEFLVSVMNVDTRSQRKVTDLATKLVVITQQVDAADLEYRWFARLLVKNA